MRKLFLATVTLFLTAQNIFSQCAMCKAAAESDMENNPNSVAKGINAGILFLMVIPYILMFFFFRKEITGFFKGRKESEGNE
ncbi:MAG: hypothetical protein KatS3mg028_0437 [Bacteroidia bacterium]|nr:MAG: hypothetical protein KatS3mg028_0437 [Bacteroidia bacterium]